MKLELKINDGKQTFLYDQKLLNGIYLVNEIEKVNNNGAILKEHFLNASENEEEKYALIEHNLENILLLTLVDSNIVYTQFLILKDKINEEELKRLHYIKIEKEQKDLIIAYIF